MSAYLLPVMIGGMVATAGYNSALASTVDFDEKCDNVDQLAGAIGTMDGFLKQSATIAGKQNSELNNMNNTLVNYKDNITAFVNKNKTIQEKQTNRIKLFSIIGVVIIFCLFLVKYFTARI